MFSEDDTLDLDLEMDSDSEVAGTDDAEMVGLEGAGEREKRKSEEPTMAAEGTEDRIAVDSPAAKAEPRAGQEKQGKGETSIDRSSWVDEGFFSKDGGELGFIIWTD
ncbi:hypothetical protein IAT38_001083 [Cryptococcus sp. DSM 104549]